MRPGRLRDLGLDSPDHPLIPGANYSPSSERTRPPQLARRGRRSRRNRRRQTRRSRRARTERTRTPSPRRRLCLCQIQISVTYSRTGRPDRRERPPTETSSTGGVRRGRGGCVEAYRCEHLCGGCCGRGGGSGDSGADYTWDDWGEYGGRGGTWGCAIVERASGGRRVVKDGAWEERRSVR
jgi:hypothetical protein